MGEPESFFFPSRHQLTRISVLFASGGTRPALMVAWTANTLGLCRLYQHWPQDVLLRRSVIKARQPAHCPYITAHTLLIAGCKLCHLISLNFILARLTDVTVSRLLFCTSRAHASTLAAFCESLCLALVSQTSSVLFCWAWKCVGGSTYYFLAKLFFLGLNNGETFRRRKFAAVCFHFKTVLCKYSIVKFIVVP